MQSITTMIGYYLTLTIRSLRRAATIVALLLLLGSVGLARHTNLYAVQPGITPAAGRPPAVTGAVVELRTAFCFAKIVNGYCLIVDFVV